MKLKYKWNAIIPTLIITVGLGVFPILNPCTTENARACTWHAENIGNGTGNSFTDYYGLKIYHFN